MNRFESSVANTHGSGVLGNRSFSMDTALFKKSPSGKLVRSIGGYWAFVPGPLPPELE